MSHLSQHPSRSVYRGRLAPSPTGFLHLGHARTFWTAQERARQHHGTLVLRNEDLDRARTRPEFVRAMFEDLRWFGFAWQEGPDSGGPLGPYTQSERIDHYREAFEELRAGGFIYPCHCSRQDVLRALAAPHVGEDEPIYPGTCRPKRNAEHHSSVNPQDLVRELELRRASGMATPSSAANWRFQVQEGESISFTDGHYGPQQFVAGKDFGDFVVWRNDDLPAYQLAVVVDDAAMQITEVVRGEDLLKSTARQLLLYQALRLKPPAFYHCPLVTDDAGIRLAKRHDSLSLRSLRERGLEPADLWKQW